MRKIHYIRLMVCIFVIASLSLGAFAETLSEVDYRSTVSNNNHKDALRSALNPASIAFDSLDVSFISQDPDPVEPGKYVTLRFKVENLGSEKTGDLYFRLKTDYPFSFDRADADVIHVGSLLPRTTGSNAAIIKYVVRVDKNAVEGTSYVDIVQFYNDDESTAITTEDFAISVRSFDSILVIEDIDISPEDVPPGSIATLTIKVKNIADSYLDDIKITADYLETTKLAASVDRHEIPLTPFKDTNEKVIEHLLSDQEKIINFDFIIDPDAKPGVYKLPLTIKYVDATGANYSKSSLVGVVVGDAPDMITHISDTDIYSAGNKGTVTVEFVNKGLTDIKLLYIALMDNPNEYTILSPKEVYVGNIDSDDYETADFDLYVPSTVKDHSTLRLNVEYRDNNNKLHQEQLELPLKLYSESDAKKYGYVASSGSTVKILFLIILVVVAFFAWKWWKKRKKKN